MNNPNPFVPQGSLLEEKNRKRARVKVAVYTIFALNILLISPFLLIQGCKKEPTPDTTQVTNTDTNMTTADTNVPPPLPPATNTLATASNTIPTPPPAPEPPQAPPAPTTGEYVIQKGDSYYSIGKKNGVSMKAIEAANPGVNPSKLKLGQKIQLPGSTGTSGATTSVGGPAMSDSGEATYVVKANDSLTKIAKVEGVSIKAIKTANHLKTDKITVGQKLKIPAKTAPAADTSTPPAAPVSAPVPMTPPPAAPAH